MAQKKQAQKQNVMTNDNLYSIKKVIQRVKTKGGNDFKFPLIRTEMEIDKYLEALEKLREPSKDIQAYEQERRELISKHAETDEQGNIVLYSEPNGVGNKKTDGYGFPNIVKDEKGYVKSIEGLQKKYEQAIKEREKQINEFNTKLAEEVKDGPKLYKMPFNVVPDLEYDELKILMPLIEE